MVEKLRYEDSFVNEILVNKINELIDELEKLEERMSSRIDNHWAYHRHLKHEIEENMKKLIDAEKMPKETKEKEENGK